jgi:hypothetical protein
MVNGSGRKLVQTRRHPAPRPQNRIIVGSHSHLSPCRMEFRDRFRPRPPGGVISGLSSGYRELAFLRGQLRLG